jgi:hypothetical protein
MNDKPNVTVTASSEQYLKQHPEVAVQNMNTLAKIIGLAATVSAGIVFPPNYAWIPAAIAFLAGLFHTKPGAVTAQPVK